MRGLIDVPTRTFGLGLGVVIFDALAAACIIFCTITIYVKKWNLETRTRTLLIGMMLLSLWSFLNFIDIVIRQARAKVTYAYILVECIYSILRVTSDIFVIWGVCKLMLRQIKLRYDDINDIFRAIAILLWVLGIYHICLKFAVALSWLGCADIHMIENLAHNRNAFEIAFQTVQFILYLSTGGFHIAMIDEIDLFLFASCILLGIRSFCEIIIVGQLDRNPTKLQDILRARSVMYCLCSAAFAIATTIDLLDKNLDGTLVNRETNAIDFVRDFVIRTTSENTQSGRNTAPELAEVLKRAEKERPNDEHVKAEVKRLRKCFRDWEPINRWDGSTSGTINIESTAGRGALHSPQPPPARKKGGTSGFLEAALAKCRRDIKNSKTKT